MGMDYDYGAWSIGLILRKGSTGYPFNGLTPPSKPLYMPIWCIKKRLTNCKHP